MIYLVQQEMFIWLKKLENKRNSDFPTPISEIALAADCPALRLCLMIPPPTHLPEACVPSFVLELLGSELETLGLQHLSDVQVQKLQC